jgi:hypothetical protein
MRILLIFDRFFFFFQFLSYQFNVISFEKKKLHESETKLKFPLNISQI